MLSFLIQGGPFGDIAGDVGDRNDETPAATYLLAPHGIVEITRIFAVDGDQSDVAQIFSAPLCGCADCVAIRLCLRNRFGREFKRQAVRVNRDLGFHARRCVFAEHPHDMPERLGRPGRLFDDLHEHDLACARLTDAVARHEHAMADARIVRNDEADAGFVVEPTHDFRGAALEYFDHRAFRATALIGAAHAHGDPIAVHHFAHLTIGKNDRRRAIVRMHEPVPIAMAADGADRQGQPFPEAVLVASVPDELAGVKSRIELRLQSGTFGGGCRPDSDGEFIELQRTPCVGESSSNGECCVSRGRRPRSRAFPAFGR